MTFNITELNNKLEGMTHYSGKAVSIVSDILYEFEQGNETDVNELVWESVDSSLIYYADTYEYLEANVWDTSHAVAEGFGNTLGGIAAYYLQEEVYNILNEIGLDY